ncbi:MAG: transglutaminase domain-containing protein [Ethanoligenens sp.]
MKRFSFLYQSAIRFSHPVKAHHFRLKCLPGQFPFQHIYQEHCALAGEVAPVEGIDALGNRTLAGTIPEPHDRFAFTITGKALQSYYLSREPLDDLFLYETPLTRMSDAMSAFGESVPSGTAGEQAQAVCKAVHAQLTYLPASTDVDMPAADAFAQGKGVCQDYVQIVLALLRSRNIPARYCAGLMPGEGETHAWVEYYEDGAWRGIDPTNDQIIDYGYIKLSHGRDSADCSVDRGCFVGPAEQVKQEMEIHVKVGEIVDEESGDSQSNMSACR